MSIEKVQYTIKLKFTAIFCIYWIFFKLKNGLKKYIMEKSRKVAYFTHRFVSGPMGFPKREKRSRKVAFFTHRFVSGSMGFLKREKRKPQGGLFHP